jgi:diguanylate cyclase (GGDEF)-like protein
LRSRSPASEPAPAAEIALLLAVAAAVGLGFADADRAPLHAARAAALLALPLALFSRGLQSRDAAARRGQRAPLWVPSALLGSAVLLQAVGGPGGPMSALAFLASGAASLSVGHALTLPWAGLLLLSTLLPGWTGQAAAAPALAQVGFALGVAACALLPGKALDSERRSHERTRMRLRALEDEAGGLRRESGQALPDLRTHAYGHDEFHRDLRSIARELQQDMDRACALLVAATGARTAAVYRPDGDETGERLVAVSTAGDSGGLVSEVAAREGVFGAAFKAGSPVCLRTAGADDPRLVYRSDRERTAAVLALPLVDGERRWGVVILDGEDGARLVAPATREVSGNIADFVARLITRAVDLSAVREGMRENHAFYEACREVSRHVRITDIAESVVHSAGAFVNMDACALALSDDGGAMLRVVASRGFDPEPPSAPFFITPNEGLLAQAVRHHTVIDRPDLLHSERAPLLFGQHAGPVAGFSGLLVLPIVPPGASEAAPLGAMVVARRGGPDFEPEARERLQVLLHQVGAAISNGRLFAEHESRGITDGMSGLPNHRRFQEVLAQKIAAAQRTRVKLSLLLLDIDKFKSVNDKYGHPMGDEVIRRLAGVLRQAVRDGTDLAARYGGEEFCLLLEGTDAAGAAVLADRVREAWKEEVFVHRDGARPVTFRCSVSIGVACWPDDAQAPQELVDHADQALYESKEGGRDRTTCWSAARAQPRTAAMSSSLRPSPRPTSIA